MRSSSHRHSRTNSTTRIGIAALALALASSVPCTAPVHALPAADTVGGGRPAARHLRLKRQGLKRVRLRRPLRHGRNAGKTRGLLVLGQLGRALGKGSAKGSAARRSRTTSGLQNTRPVDAVLSRMVADLLASGRKITRGRVRELGTFAALQNGDTRLGRWAIQLLVDKHADRFADKRALANAKALLAQQGGPMKRPDNAVYAVRGKDGDHTTRNHELIIKGDGVVDGATGRRTYSRGWLQANQLPLQGSHGSKVPPTKLLSQAERAALDKTPTAARLDRAAKLLTGKSQLGGFTFAKLATFPKFAAKDQPDWGGHCYSWSSCALDSRLSKLVDVRGPKGQRGLWIAGQWISRADLGSFLTATASAYAQSEGQVMWYSPEAQDVVKAALGYLQKGGKGFRADIGTSFPNPSEIWFQPFVGAKVKVSSVTPEAKRRLLSVAAQAKRNPISHITTPGVKGVEVKLIRIRARYGDEKGERHEGSPSLATIRWNAYAVLDAKGKAQAILMANDPRLKTMVGLPEKTSSAVPRDLFVSDHWYTDALLAGKKVHSLQNSLYGPHLSFLVGTVLARGVPGHTRAAFEREALRGSGRLAPDVARKLAQRYPTVANAYTPEQWSRHFGARGLAAKDFGLVAQTQGTTP